MAIQSSRLATMTLSSSDSQPKRRSQFCISIASALSAPAAPESFDATHITASSVKSRGTVSGTSPYFSKAAHVGFSMRETRVSGCLSQRTSATGRPVLVHWSSRRRNPTPPIPVGCPTDGLPKLTRQHRVMVAPGYRLLLLLSAPGGSALPRVPFRLGIPYQARMETPLPEFHPPGDLCPDLLGPADAQHLREDDAGKDKGSLGVPTPVNYPLPLHGQYGHEAEPHFSYGRGIPASRLVG